MRDLWKIIEALHAKKYTTRLSHFPKGHMSFAAFLHGNQEEQHLYGADNIDKLEADIKKDFGHLLTVTSLPKMPGLPAFPSPIGFPKP